MNTWSERGLIVQGDVTKGKDLIATDGWDDDIIMKIFNASVSSHSTKVRVLCTVGFCPDIFEIILYLGSPKGKAKKKRKLMSTLSEAGTGDPESNALVGEPGPWEQVSSEAFQMQVLFELFSAKLLIGLYV